MFLLSVTAVVENVTVDGLAEAVDETSTSAKPGAGTLTRHVPADWSHWTVWIDSVPWNRPSASKRPPRV